jgi:replicative DNA helicase
MTNGQLMRRLIAQEANVNLKAYDDDRRAGKDVTRQTLALNEAAEVIKTLPLHFCEKTAITLGEILAQIKKWHTRKGIESVFVDYLQLVSGLEKIGNREQQVAIISRALKNIALRLKIRMTALSQLSRPAKGSEGRRPVLTDLRESGAIEQDAGIVLFLHRPAYYGITTNEDGTPVSESDCEVITAKNREGQMNVISNVKFNDKTGVFSDYDTNMREDSYERQTRSIQKRITPPENDDETPF